LKGDKIDIFFFSFSTEGFMVHGLSGSRELGRGRSGGASTPHSQQERALPEDERGVGEKQ
jgi:hypothetical protein